MDGLLPVWKPKGMTSYDVIRIWKKTYGKQDKIGHAGTLDPFAEGVLILMLGRGTRKFDEIQSWPKTYRAVARLGAKSDTLDTTGIVEVTGTHECTVEQVQKAAERFVGETEQVVPQYSAAKYKGKPLYKYARKGEGTPEKKKKIVVYSLEVLKVGDERAELLITCSSGTYIRQLSYDIFRTLGIESYLTELVREKVGEITKKVCIMVDELTDVDMVRQRVLPTHGE